MRGLLGLLCAVTVATIGCQSSGPATDPFLRSRIPPPGTGQVGPVPVGTYGSPPPPPPPPPIGGAYAPPGGNFTYGGNNVTPVTPPPAGPPAASIPAAPTYSPPAAPMYQAPPAAMPSAPPSSSAPQYAPPNGGWAPTSSTGAPPTTSMHSQEAMQRELRPLAESTRAGRLTDAAGDGPADDGITPGVQRLDGPQDIKDSPLTQTLPTPRVSQVQPASYSAPQSGARPRPRSAYATTNGPADGTSIVGAAPPATGRTQPLTTGTGPADRGATYGFDGNYVWLQGQLEYSQATKQWKLRYIPIDGPQDRYGGSVVLSATSALNGYKAGSFVSVKGQLDANRTTPQGSISPLYLVTSVDRLSD